MRIVVRILMMSFATSSGRNLLAQHAMSSSTTVCVSLCTLFVACAPP